MEKMNIEEAALREWFLKREGKRVYRWPIPKSRVGGGWMNRVYALWYDRGVYIWPGLAEQFARDCAGGGVVRYFDTRKERDAYAKNKEIELRLKQIGRYE